MQIDFNGKVAVVTGAAGAIGRAVSLALAGLGAKVLVVDLSVEQGQETARQIQTAGGEARFVCADVSRSQDVANYVAEAMSAWGRIDIFINNAAWQGAVQNIVDYPDDVFDKVMAINVRGVYLGLKHVLPVMISQRSGNVVNTASLGAYVGTRQIAPYIASKHAVMGLTKSVAMEVARKGIRVNAVCPGPVDTPMLRDIEAGQAGETGAASLRAKRAAGIPEGRYAQPEEVANLMIYLASDLSTHITGQGVQINGGMNS
jgi:NAD(P)-dependent dehydrogenase (short-subunit alcohol dehydrogenase family)